MKNTYIEVWKEAFRRYQNRDQRPGYSFGLMSRFRHSLVLYPALKEFKTRVGNRGRRKKNGVIKKWLKDARLKEK